MMVAVLVCATVLVGIDISRRGKTVASGSSWAIEGYTPHESRSLIHDWLAKQGFEPVDQKDEGTIKLRVTYNIPDGATPTDLFVKKFPRATPVYCGVTVFSLDPSSNMSKGSSHVGLTVGCADSPWPWEWQVRRAEIDQMLSDFDLWIDKELGLAD